MNKSEFVQKVNAGELPLGEGDWGPHTDGAKALIRELDGQLFSFSGKLDDRYIEIASPKDAKDRQLNAGPGSFNWEKDQCYVWGMDRPENFFSNPEVWWAYEQNFKGVNRAVNAIVKSRTPDHIDLDFVDAVYADLVGLVMTYIKFGRLDEFSGWLFNAYRQGGWPCGLTGGPPREFPEADWSKVDPIELEDRKMYVFWPV